MVSFAGTALRRIAPKWEHSDEVCPHLLLGTSAANTLYLVIVVPVRRYAVTAAKQCQKLLGWRLAHYAVSMCVVEAFKGDSPSHGGPS